MTRIAVLGGGAFGTALALVLARDGRDVTLWARDPEVTRTRRSPRLPGAVMPESLKLTHDIAEAQADIALLAVPMQQLAGFLAGHLVHAPVLVACCKGIDLATGQGPSQILRSAAPDAIPALISGPGFAADLAAGLPTALTLACDAPGAEDVQAALSVGCLRLYLSNDLRGVEIGGALKNVIAIACGIVIGAGLGESARAALLTRGYAEMVRFAVARGARAQTLTGLSGLGDLVLTCASEKSRNYRHGLSIGRGTPPDASATVEGVATCHALARLAGAEALDMPVTRVLAAVLDGRLSTEAAMQDLLSRPLKAE